MGISNGMMDHNIKANSDRVIHMGKAKSQIKPKTITTKVNSNMA